MDQATITTLTRNGLRDLRYSSTDITSMTLLGVLEVGKKIQVCDPTFFRGRMILSSGTHVFDWPSDCMSVNTVWDTLTSSLAITEATNATPINITAADHGLSNSDIVLVSGVTGCTAANGIWDVTYVDDDNVVLDLTTGNGTYTHGGGFTYPARMIKLSSSFRKMTKKNSTATNLRSRHTWHPEGKKVVIDYLSHTDDIIVDYQKRPDAIDDIPEEYHMGLVGWNVMNLLEIPEPDAPTYGDKVEAYRAHRAMFNAAVNSIQNTMNSTTEPVDFNDVEGWDRI